MRKRPVRKSLGAKRILLAAVSAGASQEAFGNAANVDFVIGDVRVRDASGRDRALARGNTIAVGDTVATNNGRAHLRFADGGYVSLQPGTDFAVRDFKFEGKADGSESALFGLVRGAMRTVTGLVGRVNRNRYQIATPTATVGIRGTGGLIEILANGSTLVSGSSGIWSLTNSSGSIDIPAGTAGIAGPDQNLPPTQSSRAPSLPPAQLSGDPPGFQAGEDRSALPTAAGAGMQTGAVPLGSGTYSVTIGYGAYGGGGGYGYGGGPYGGPGGEVAVGNWTAVVATAGSGTTMNPAGQVTRLVQGAVTYDFLGTFEEGGNDGVLAWGRWSGQIDQNGSPWQNYTSDQGFHYLVATPPTAMPVGGQFTYNLYGSTLPTFLDGSISPGSVLAGSTLVGDFTNAKVGLNLQVSIGGEIYSAVTAGFNAGGPNPASQISFSPSGAITGAGNFASSPSSCSGGCPILVQGSFAGAGWSHAGIVYHVNSPAASGGFIGAAAFKK